MPIFAHTYRLVIFPHNAGRKRQDWNEGGIPILPVNANEVRGKYLFACDLSRGEEITKIKQNVRTQTIKLAVMGL